MAWHDRPVGSYWPADDDRPPPQAALRTGDTSVQLDKRLIARIHDAATMRRVSRSAIVRAALEAYLGAETEAG